MRWRWIRTSCSWTNRPPASTRRKSARPAFDRLILTLRDALGLTVFLVTHDLDTLYAICDRVAVLSARRVLVADRIEAVAAFDDPWIQQYFQGPRGRAASQAALRASATPTHQGNA